MNVQCTYICQHLANNGIWDKHWSMVLPPLWRISIGKSTPKVYFATTPTKQLICFKGLVELRSRPQVEVLPDIQMGSKADTNSLATTVLLLKSFYIRRSLFLITGRQYSLHEFTDHYSIQSNCP